MHDHPHHDHAAGPAPAQSAAGHHAQGAAGHHAHGGHGHHAHAPTRFGAAFAVGMALNLLYVGGEAAYGLVGGSLALLADAGHNLGDVLGLGAAWLAATLGRRRPTLRYTYGLRRATVLSALFNAVLLLLVSGGIAAEAVRRLLDPEPVAGRIVTVVAAIGIAVNGGTALLFARGRHHDLNLRAAFQHMAADAVMASAVVAAGLLILWTGIPRIDPAVSLAVALAIVASSWSVLRQSVALALDAVPAGIDRAAVERALRDLPGVTDLHHLHIWGMSTTEAALTAHLVRPGLPPDDALLRSAAAMLRGRHGIGHATFQVENGDGGGERCALSPDGAG